MTSPLENLSGPGKLLRKEAPDAKEFAGLKQSGLTRLSDAENKTNSLESRFDLAYNAAHALSLEDRVEVQVRLDEGRRHQAALGLDLDRGPLRQSGTDARDALATDADVELSAPLRPSTGCVARNTRTLGGRLSTVRTDRAP